MINFNFRYINVCLQKNVVNPLILKHNSTYWNPARNLNPLETQWADFIPLKKTAQPDLFTPLVEASSFWLI